MSSAISMMFFAPNVSPAAVLLVFSGLWQIRFFAIYRRRSSGRRSDQPDRLLFHQRTMYVLEIAVMGKHRRELTNPLATAIFIPMIAVPQLVGFVSAQITPWRFCTLILFCLFIRSALISSERRPTFPLGLRAQLPIKLLMPLDDSLHPVADVSFRLVTRERFEERGIGPCCGHVAGLHRHEVAAGFEARGFFYRIDEIGKLHGVRIADVHHTPWRDG